LAEEEIKQAKENHERLVNNLIGCFVFRHDLSGMITYVSKSVNDVLGYTPEEFLVNYNEFLTDHPINREIAEHLAQTLKGIQQLPFELQVYHKDRSIRWLVGSETAVRDRSGDIIAVEGVVHDITARKLAEKKREEVLHAMEERVKELRCMYGVARSVRTRTTLEEIFQDAAELIPPSWHYPEITRGKVIFNEKEYASEPFEETDWKQSSDIIVNGERRGSIEVYYLKECPDLDEGPFMTEERDLINGIARNVSEAIERKHVDEEIKRAKEKYETLVSNMPEAIYSALADEKGTSIFMSERWGQWTGYNTNDPEIWQKSVHPDDRERTIKVYLEAAKEKKDYTLDYRVVHKDSGQVRWVCDHGSPVIDEKGNVVRFDGIVTDITERKKAEDERERLLKTIQAKKEELQSIVYVASHDLRSPLVNIEGFAGELGQTCLELKQTLKDNCTDQDLNQKLLSLLDEDIPESLKFINAGTTKIESLLEGLLQVSRVGSTKVEIKPLDMNKMMGEILRTMEFQIKKDGVELIVEDIPDCFGDKAMANQLFSNILGNALKYLNPKRQGRIHISGRIENGMSVYCIEDNGIGISPANQEKVFEIFRRINPNDGIGGEGLGLSIVMRILDRLEGQIRVESEPGKGSKFFISVPTIIPNGR
jgi:PAS domain S-box-containing protein